MEEKTMSNKILIETSARHVHVSAEALEVLFGKGAELTKKKDLSQPGQYACEERVTIVGPKKQLANVSILGPVRPATQVELSATDARSIGVPVVIRESGDIAGTPGCKIIGPAGEIEISEGVIVAKRHIHMIPETAEKLGLKNKDIVWVKAETDGRTALLGDVVVRVSETFADAMHIDTDESNAICAAPGMFGEIIKSL
ncbi:MAG: phosphate propanoyltransferase [Ruminiclostridium sp.]|nr:phosphate propanoyltransferase [Ruminiclostridium sp.]